MEFLLDDIEAINDKEFDLLGWQSSLKGVESSISIFLGLIQNVWQDGEIFFVAIFVTVKLRQTLLQEILFELLDAPSEVFCQVIE